MSDSFVNESEELLILLHADKGGIMFTRRCVCVFIIMIGIIAFSASAQATITVDKDLNIHVPCVDVNGIFYQIDLNRFAHPNDPSGLYWELAEGIYPAEDDGSCAVLGEDISLFLPNVNVMGTVYDVILTYSPEFQCPNMIIWKFGGLSPGASDPSEDYPDKNYYYKGTLTVSFTNAYPEWSVSETMDVMIEKGYVSIEDGALNYSGETLVSDDSKIARRGAWQMFPTGEIITIEDQTRVDVDAHIDVIDDTTEVYAKTKSGEWIMIKSFSVSNQPCSQVSFSFEEALGGGGAVTGVDVESGSIIWTLYLEPVESP